ncbi:protein-arginine deiminase type-3-like isoform X3 [Hemicordylus capensis]|nr:protein-arginine deiminase type-3-like isoform X3 [Hemicordylus capensis]XP_053136529.1 protein-arginine deiminase type-3-like isoform X3 [Hemicordylus capensis]XP_053136530.1 protein-arginine deiminase type-3-like isoform X3 [Hemicordylus capensis]XP_053136531.1 protein-arginine deiminase type-3-like isoform X3 [Hemicordylus capensis]
MVKVPCCVPRWPLDPSMEVVVTMDTPSADVDEDKVRVSYYKDNGKMPIAKAMLHLTCVEISLDVDTNRSGTVTRRAKDKKNWTWGPEGKGAILLVNCDRDDPRESGMDNQDKEIQSYADLRDMSLMVLTTRGPDEVFEDHQLVLHISASDSDKVGVFHARGKKQLRQYQHVLGSGKLSYVVEHRSGREENIFYVEGLKFPDVDFSGLVSFHVTLLESIAEELPEAPIFNDMVVFRIAPWIMTPNTLQPVTVYVCSTGDNTDFVASLSKVTHKVGCKLIICPEAENRHDRWIQDEMEIGYIQAPHKTFPVVFDSPRNRGLKDFPIKSVLGPDFGYVTREPVTGNVSGLDSFGNLEVSPPVTVKGKEYPLGRMLFGGHLPSPQGDRMVKVVRDFLYAQKVQSPVELYSDWLVVGHVDEFLSFVPASDRKGFRLLLASPSACYRLLKEKEQEGYGDAVMFEGLKEGKHISIKKILEDTSLRNSNEYFQKCIDWNRDVLKEELELMEEDIIDVPQLFYPGFLRKASAYFPDTVNMLVLGKYLVIPKPFGPIIHGECCLEQEVRRLLEPLGLSCTFIDDYETYHQFLGEVHCGTNVRRKPFSFKWWNMIP